MDEAGKLATARGELLVGSGDCSLPYSPEKRLPEESGEGRLLALPVALRAAWVERQHF